MEVISWWAQIGGQVAGAAAGMSMFAKTQCSGRRAGLETQEGCLVKNPPGKGGVRGSHDGQALATTLSAARLSALSQSSGPSANRDLPFCPVRELSRIRESVRAMGTQRLSASSSPAR